jgi:hypothetical protein
MKTFYAYDHERDKEMLIEMQNKFKEVKKMYSHAHFKLGFQKQTSTCTGGEKNTTTEFEQQSETKEQYPRYESNLYQYKPRFDTSQNDLRRTQYNHF